MLIRVTASTNHDQNEPVAAAYGDPVLPIQLLNDSLGLGKNLSNFAARYALLEIRKISQANQLGRSE